MFLQKKHFLYEAQGEAWRRVSSCNSARSQKPTALQCAFDSRADDHGGGGGAAEAAAAAPAAD